MWQTRRVWTSSPTMNTSKYIYMQRRQWHPTPVLLPGKSHGQRSLVGCSPWGRQESDTTQRLHFHFSLSCIGEGNGNPFQCSCLEKPRDGGACQAAIPGVTQSWTQLKGLSTSSHRVILTENKLETDRLLYNQGCKTEPQGIRQEGKRREQIRTCICQRGQRRKEGLHKW